MAGKIEWLGELRDPADNPAASFVAALDAVIWLEWFHKKGRLEIIKAAQPRYRLGRYLSEAFSLLYDEDGDYILALEKTAWTLWFPALPWRKAALSRQRKVLTIAAPPVPVPPVPDAPPSERAARGVGPFILDLTGNPRIIRLLENSSRLGIGLFEKQAGASPVRLTSYVKIPILVP